MGLPTAVYKAFVRLKGYVFGSITLLAAILFYIFAPTSAVSNRIFLPVVVLLVMIIAVLIEATRDALHMSMDLPKTLKAIQATNLYPDAEAILVLSKSKLFSYDVLVTVYYKEKEYERMIGFGFVSTIQTDELIQVVASRIDETDEIGVLWKKVNNNNKETLENLIVKPAIHNRWIADRVV